MDKIVIDGVELILSNPVNMDVKWIGQEELLEQVLAAWMKIHENDLPLAPRILGVPGIGKTTLAYVAAKKVNKEVYIFQCTSDTRPEDLLINPVVGSHQEIRYHASPLVSAMIRGAACILDEGNRMPEKTWASLAPLLDKRRYIESTIAGIQVQAHPDFRIAVTMNQDASVFDIPEYIASRLQPKIHVPYPNREDEFNIVKYNIPFAPNDIVEYVVDFLQRCHQRDLDCSVRDGINITRYMLKLSIHDDYPLSPELMESYLNIAAEGILESEKTINNAKYFAATIYDKALKRNSIFNEFMRDIKNEIEKNDDDEEDDESGDLYEADDELFFKVDDGGSFKDGVYDEEEDDYYDDDDEDYYDEEEEEDEKYYDEDIFDSDEDDDDDGYYPAN
ncbi:MAG: AAA family ATPase [Promethearchaeota archaeon]